MNDEIVADLKNWFLSYVGTFKTTDADFQKNIDLKEKHTMRVCTEILDIGKELRLHNHELHIAEVIALFHDIGRFEQYARYHTFVDHYSENHAELGVKILQQNDVLYRLDESIQELIYRVILYHNRATLPQKETTTCLLFCKLLRDADKLDIWRIVTGYYHRENGKRNGVLELGLPDTQGISDEVYNDLIDGRIVDVSHLRNLNDFKLLQVGWVYDINFVPTFRRICERNYIDMIKDALPKLVRIEKIFTIVHSYLKQKTN